MRKTHAKFVMLFAEKKLVFFINNMTNPRNNNVNSGDAEAESNTSDTESNTRNSESSTSSTTSDTSATSVSTHESSNSDDSGNTDFGDGHDDNSQHEPDDSDTLGEYLTLPAQPVLTTDDGFDRFNDLRNVPTVVPMTELRERSRDDAQEGDRYHDSVEDMIEGMGQRFIEEANQNFPDDPEARYNLHIRVEEVMESRLDDLHHSRDQYEYNHDERQQYTMGVGTYSINGNSPRFLQESPGNAFPVDSTNGDNAANEDLVPQDTPNVNGNLAPQDTHSVNGDGPVNIDSNVNGDHPINDSPNVNGEGPINDTPNVNGDGPVNDGPNVNGDRNFRQDSSDITAEDQPMGYGWGEDD